VARHNHLDSHLFGALDDGVEVIDLEPEQQTVAVGRVVAVGDGTVVVRGLEAVELQDKLIVETETIIVRAAMVAAQAKEVLVPAAAGLDVSDGDEGLRTHDGSFGVRDWAMRVLNR
jgi:F0F1-type ATP synthase alpha subunit